MKNSNTKVIGGTIIALVLVGTYYNSQQITRLKPIIISHDLPSPTGRKQRGFEGDQNRSSMSQQQKDSCLKARKDTVPKAMFGKLSRPFINLGLPKMGTSSLHAFFDCGGLKSHHFQCGKDSVTNRRISCAKCISNSIEANKPPLALCEEADIYTQIDNGTYFPQVELINEFAEGYPKATFFLTFRNMTKWYHSLSHWPPRPRGPHMDERLRKLNITGFPSGKGKNEEEFTEWYCNHVLRVREIVASSQGHHLVEVDIEDTTIGGRMSEMFGISESCWGHANVNLNIHPDVNTSEVTASKRQAKQLKKMEGSNINGDSDDQKNSLDDEQIDSGDSDDISCLKARNNTISPSLYRNLPKPFINLGFPKMGTTTLNAFFKCGGYKSHHYLCGDKLLCASCIQQSIHKREPPFARCNDGDVWTQLDNGRWFPQIELLEKIVEGYPQATFFLMFRSMEKWHNSLLNWPPNRTKHKAMTERLLQFNITGLQKGNGSDISVFSDWHCGHVNRVRELVSKYPSHSLVEIDIEDDVTGERMSEMFGINETCWAHANANVNKQPDIDLSAQLEITKIEPN